MSLISTLKSLLGLESKQRTRERDTSVTVERNEPVAEETDAAASTESLVEDSVEEGDADSPAEAAEPAEAAGPSEEDMETDVESVEASPDTETDEDADDDGEEPVAEETDAAASTESLVEDSVEDGETSEASEAAEPAEAAGPSEEDMETDVEDVDPDAGTGDVADTEGAEDVEIVKGVGPAYAERLHEAGVETVADLVAADAADLGDATGISPKRIGRWQESAADRTE